MESGVYVPVSQIWTGLGQFGPIVWPIFQLTVHFLISDNTGPSFLRLEWAIVWTPKVIVIATTYRVYVYNVRNILFP